jgi:glutamate racemase
MAIATLIGIFDSGYGGLTVLSRVRAVLPDRPFVYCGDHQRAPYGNRTADDIVRLTTTAVEQLFALGCRLVVLACNTASANALRRVQQDVLPRAHPDRRVLGVLVPMVEAITGVPWMADLPTASAGPSTPRTVAVFATRQTVESGAYPIEIGKRAPSVSVVQQACPHLVDLIEQGAPRDDIGRFVRTYAGQLLDQLNGRPPDVVMLGCTHYPLIADLFAAALPSGVEILCQPSLVARSLGAYLARHPEFDARLAPPVPVRYFTSGDADHVSRLASRFVGQPVEFTTLTPWRTAPIWD